MEFSHLISLIISMSYQKKKLSYGVHNSRSNLVISSSAILKCPRANDSPSQGILSEDKQT